MESGIEEESIPLWWWPTSSMTRICVAGPPDKDPGRERRIAELKALVAGKSCLRVTGKIPSNHSAKIATNYSVKVNGIPRGKVDTYKVYTINDDGALSRQVVRGRVPGQSEPERLDNKPNWDPIVKGIQYDRVLNTALARQGAIILANAVAEEMGIR